MSSESSVTLFEMLHLQQILDPLTAKDDTGSPFIKLFDPKLEESSHVFTMRPPGITKLDPPGKGPGVCLGWEICKDHYDQVLLKYIAKVLKRTPRTFPDMELLDKSPVDLHILEGCGVTRRDSSLVARQGGYVLLCDGWGNEGATNISVMDVHGTYAVPAGVSTAPGQAGKPVKLLQTAASSTVTKVNFNPRYPNMPPWQVAVFDALPLAPRA